MTLFGILKLMIGRSITDKNIVLMLNGCIGIHGLIPIISITLLIGHLHIGMNKVNNGLMMLLSGINGMMIIMDILLLITKKMIMLIGIHISGMKKLNHGNNIGDKKFLLMPLGNGMTLIMEHMFNMLTIIIYI
jgi:hypothetical protein